MLLRSTAVWICAVVSLVCAAYPMYVIRPFRAQGTSELEAALWLMQIRPLVTLVCSAIAVAVVAASWRRRRWTLVAGAVLACAAAVVSRVNIFERMFHPVDSPAFEAAAQVKIDADDKVLAVLVNQSARAYPIRAIAYHHIVNDVVGGVPIVATY